MSAPKVGRAPEDTRVAMPSLSTCALRLLRSAGRRSHTPGITIPRIEAYATLPPDPARLAAFCEVSGAVLGPWVPMTWPYAQVTRLHLYMVSSVDFPLPALGLVHLREVIVQHQAIPAEIELHVHCRIDGQRPHRRGLEFDLITEVSRRRGAPILWRSTTTALSRSPETEGLRRRPPEVTATLGPGPELATAARWRVDSATGRRYAQISRNYDPIHLHPLTSRWFGFRRPVVHGMWTVARALAALGPAATIPPRRLDVRFLSPLFLPSEVLFTAAGTDERRSFTVRPARGGRPHLVGELVHLTQASSEH